MTMNKTIGKLVFAGFGAWLGWQFGGELLCSVLGSPTSLCAGYNEAGQIATPPAQILAALGFAAAGFAIGG
jgi:hypothetical protein